MSEADKFMDRDSLCDVLRNQYYIFLKRKDIYDIWNKSWINLYLAKKNLKSKAPLVFLIIIIIGGLSSFPFIIFGIFATVIALNNKGNFENNDTNITILLILSFVITVILFVIIPLVIYFNLQRSKKKKIEKYISEMNQAKFQLEAYYRSINETVIPFDYTSPYVLWEIYEIARLGRAHSVNEAIYQYKCDAQEKMELLKKQKDVKKEQLKAIAMTCAAIYFMSRPDQVDIYIK